MTRSLASTVAALAAALVLAPAMAHAAQINGDPLSISSDDSSGRLGVAFAGAGTGEFCCLGVDSETGEVRPMNAGLGMAILYPQGGYQPMGPRYGFGGEPTGPTTITGAGSATDPFRLRGSWVYTSYQGQTVEVRQELTYVNGQQEFRARHEVVNASGDPLVFRASMGADLYGGGSDRGIGLFDAGPPRFIAGFNQSAGSVAGIAEVTPWSHFEEGQFSDVLSRADGDPSAGESLRDTWDPTEVDNGAAVQWDAHTSPDAALQPGQSAVFENIWRFTRTFALTPAVATATTGDEAPFEVALNDTEGNPRAGVRIRWATIGTNNTGGDTRTDAAGRARFTYVGANPGSDRVSAYADLNDNGQRDPDEPEREANIDWSGPPAPAFAKEVNLKPVSGVVRYRLPRRGRGKVNAAGSASRFIRLADATQIPIGAELDASRGRVQVTTAQGRGATAGVQSMQAYSGRFVVTQSRKGRGLTDLRMTAPLRCGSARSASVRSAAKRSRRLWSRGRGRFRTRGRHSSATVRGTMWLTKDTCTSTTTTVREGVVVVRDLAKRKNVRVKAGRRYVARAKKRGR